MAFTSFSTSSKTSWSTALFISLNMYQLIIGNLTEAAAIAVTLSLGPTQHHSS